MDIQPYVQDVAASMSVSSNRASGASCQLHGQRTAGSVAQPPLPPADISKLLQAQNHIFTNRPSMLCPQQMRYSMPSSHLTTLPESAGRSCAQNGILNPSFNRENQNPVNEFHNHTLSNTANGVVDNRMKVPIASKANPQEYATSTLSAIPHLDKDAEIDGKTLNVAAQRQSSEKHVPKDMIQVTMSKRVEKTEMSNHNLSQSSSNQSLISLTSKDDETMSPSRRLACKTSDIISLCSEPRTLHCQSLSSSSPTSSLPASGQSSSMKIPRKRLRQAAVSDPDSIVWTVDTQKYTVSWNKEGSLGFWIQEIKGSDEIYAMVMKVDKKSPVATSGLQCGDRVLAVNGHPIHVQRIPERKLSAAEILKQQSKKEPVCLIVQSPNSIRIKKEPQSIGPRLTQKGPGSSSDSMKDNRKLINDQSPLTRLPDLRLVIMGPYSENTAEQVVGSNVWSCSNEGSICKKCVTLIERKNDSFEWSALGDDGRSHISHLLKKMEKEESSRNESGGDFMHSSEGMVLEVVAIKNSAMAQDCSQVMMISHCLYILQFDGQSFLGDPDRHMGELQCHLDKIRTYAGSDSPVYLLGTWPSLGDYMLPSVEKIGNHLQQRFSSEFGKQLQYHGNCPFFILNQTSQHLRQTSCPSLVGSCGDHEGESDCMISPGTSPVTEFHTQSSVSTTASSSSSMLTSMTSASTSFSDFGPEACLVFLRNHIANNVFWQKFLAKSTKYPCRFLQFRKIVSEMRQGKQKCMLTSGIKQACQLEDTEELMMLVEYLHNQGVIFSPTMLKATFQHSFVALDPEDLMKVFRRLLQVPDSSQQEPGYRQQWTNLRSKGILDPSLLRHLLGEDSDAECLTICLKQLNLIHDARSVFESCDLSPGSRIASGDQAYLVPYFVPAASPLEAHWNWSLDDLTLSADFLGHLPHGKFTDLMLQLCHVAFSNAGRFRIQSRNAWLFDMGSNYSLKANGEVGKCQICFTVKCSIGYALQNVLIDILTAIQKVMPPGKKFILGPPCPLQEACVHEGSNPHVIDVGDGHVKRPLWCGNKEIGKYSSVKQWTINSNKMTRHHPDTSGSVLLRDTPIRDLPPDVIQMLCEKLNVHSQTGRDWRGLAGKLGYTYQDVQHFRTASTLHYDPCSHLLNDWGQGGSGTLGSLLTALDAPDLCRKDVICDLSSRWQITDIHDGL